MNLFNLNGTAFASGPFHSRLGAIVLLFVGLAQVKWIGCRESAPLPARSSWCISRSPPGCTTGSAEFNYLRILSSGVLLCADVNLPHDSSFCVGIYVGNAYLPDRPN